LSELGQEVMVAHARNVRREESTER
jgi:hypothetical protein